jgi:hypothetical protein
MAESKISYDQRQEILRRFAAGEQQRTLAREYGVSPSLVRKLCSIKEADSIATSEGKEQTYRESLNWALLSAGEFLRTGVRPTVCPNDAAWFLYTQAVSEPKDFMAKVAQVEKGEDGEAARQCRKNAQRSIEELDAMLSELGDGSG